MPDKIELYVGGLLITHFLNYKIDSDLYKPADAFKLELANPETQISKGSPCAMFINGKPELTGIIDKVTRKVMKDGVSLVVEGRDYMGLLIDSYVESANWVSVQNFKLQALAQRLLKTVPFLDLQSVIYQDNVTGKIKVKKKGGKAKAGSTFLFGQDAGQKIGQIEAGMTIMDVLKSFAGSRGMLFYCQPDGTLVFGRPMAKGSPEFTLTMLKSGIGNNVIVSEVIEDIEKRYKTVYVVGQQQGTDTMGIFGAANVNTHSKLHTDDSFPFAKPFVTRDNNDNVSPDMRARIIMEKQRREGTQLIYTVGRHSQNGKNWGMNQFCHIKDETQQIDGKPIDGDYLIYGRTFEMRKETGPRTIVRLGYPGLVA